MVHHESYKGAQNSLTSEINSDVRSMLASCPKVFLSDGAKLRSLPFGCNT